MPTAVSHLDLDRVTSDDLAGCTPVGPIDAPERQRLATGPNARRALLYMRVSSELQALGYSLAYQEQRCRDYAREHGFTVDERHVYIETHTGTELAERPELRRARQAMARGEVGVFICIDPDRFARRLTHTSLLLDYTERCRVDLHFTNFDFTNDVVGRFILMARAFAAELEHERILDRTASGIKQKVNKGEDGYGERLQGRGPAPFGYAYGDALRSFLVVVEREAATVREIFRLADRGLSLAAIAKALEGTGNWGPGGRPWATSTLQRLLRCTDYIGEAVRGRVAQVKLRPDERAAARKPGGVAPARQVRAQDESAWVRYSEKVVPAILVGAEGKALFARVAARLVANLRSAARGGNPEPERFLLRAGFVRCGHCGNGMNAAWGARGVPRYSTQKGRCQACDPAGGKSFGIEQATLDGAAWAAVEAHLLDPARLAAAWERLAGEDDGTADLLASARASVAAAERELTNTTAGLREAKTPRLRALIMADMEVQEARLAGLAVGVGELERTAAARQDTAARRGRLLELWATAAGRLEAGLTYADRRHLLDLLHIRAFVFAGQGWEIVALEEGEGDPDGLAGEVLASSDSRSIGCKSARKPGPTTPALLLGRSPGRAA